MEVTTKKVANRMASWGNDFKKNAMDKTKLNINQILGLVLLIIGVLIEYYFQSFNGIIENYSQSFNGIIFIIFGTFIFLLSSKISIGIIISLAIILLGNVLKIMHYPYGQGLVLLGTFGFFSFGLAEYYKHRSLNYLLITISILLILIGINLKVYHLNFGTETTVAGMLLLFFSYLYRFYKKDNKVMEDYHKLIIAFLWIVSGIFSFYHIKWKALVSAAFITTFLAWILLSFVREIKKN